MTKKDITIKEIIEEFWVKCHGKSVHEDGWILLDGFDVEAAQDWLHNTLNTITKHHEVELEKVREAERERIGHGLLWEHNKNIPYDLSYDELQNFIKEVLTPTKTDK